MDQKTKDFLSKIELLIEKGVIKNHAEVVSTLNWNKSVMSSVKNGVLPVPLHIYNKFKETYSEQLASINGSGGEDWRDEKIAFLKEQNGYLKERLANLEGHYKSYLSSDTLEGYLQGTNALAKTILHEILVHRVSMEKKELPELIAASNTKYDEELASLRAGRK